MTKRKQVATASKPASNELAQRVAGLLAENAELKKQVAGLKAGKAEPTQTGVRPTDAQRLLQALLDNIPDWIYFKDTQSRFLKCSKTHAQRLCVEPDQVVGKTDFDFHPKEIAEGFHRDEQRIIQTGEPLINKVEKKLKPNGEMIWMSTTKVPMRNESGAIIGIVGVNRDITERIRTEEALRQADAKLAQERRMLRTLIDNLPDGIYAKDTAGRKILANPADLKVMKCQTEADALGKTDFDFFPADIAAQFSTDDQKVIQGQPVVNREEYFLDEAGQKHWLLTSKLPLRNEHGKIVGLVGIGRDITERKHAEAALRQAQEQLEQRVAERTKDLSQERRVLRTLIDNLPDIIFVKDAQSRFVISNTACMQQLGAKHPDEVLGKSDADFVAPELAAQYRADEQALMQSGWTVNKEEPTQHKGTGEMRWSLTTKVPLKDDLGKVVGLMGIARDITERKRTAEALTRERRLLRTLIDNLPDLIFVKDAQSRFIVTNTACAKQLGASQPEEVLGKSDADFVTPDLAAQYRADEQALMLSGWPVHKEERTQHKGSGKIGWSLTTKVPLKDDAGNVIGLIGIARDITALKDAEQALEQTHKQLMETSRMAGMAEVATGVLHNVGNVLNSVNVSASLISERLRESNSSGVAKLAKLLQEHQGDMGHFLAQDERGHQVPTYLEQLAVHLDRERNEVRGELKSLTSNIEHIKEIVATQQNYAQVSGLTESVVLPDLLEDALKIHLNAFERHGVTVAREFDPLPAITVDKHRVMQIVVNLLSNAKYASDAGGRKEKQVTVRIKTASAGRVKIEVADNGVGIAAKNLTRIFAQGFTTRKDGHGFGLHSGALAARDMGGSLSVHSDGVGRGATFTLELPVLPPQDQPEKPVEGT